MVKSWLSLILNKASLSSVMSINASISKSLHKSPIKTSISQFLFFYMHIHTVSYAHTGFCAIISCIYMYKAFFSPKRLMMNATTEVIHPGESVTWEVPQQIVPELLRKYEPVLREWDTVIQQWENSSVFFLFFLQLSLGVFFRRREIWIHVLNE